MELDDRISVLAKLGQKLLSDGLPINIINSSRNRNQWFTEKNVQDSINAIARKYLDHDELIKFVKNYDLSQSVDKTLGLILAGNIPLVGIHDVICVFLVGAKAKIKMSEKDAVLLPYFIKQLTEIDSKCKEYFTIVERLDDYDAIIATGSDSSRRYFEKYFSKSPALLRGHRNGIGVIYNDTTEQALDKLGLDIFNFFGLGCRNVSKIYVERGVDLKNVFKSLDKYAEVLDHNKYANNYTYNYALYLLNQEKFLTNDFIILRENKSLHSRIAAVHYEYFDNAEKLSSDILDIRDQIQCIVSDRPLINLEVLPFGESQNPGLGDFADNIDTMKFLTELNN